MYITKLEVFDKVKVKVYIDDEYHFMLYQKDIKIYRLEENQEITEEIYQKIRNDTVLRRGKQKALYILKHMDRTEHELRLKLKQAYYSDEIIHTIIDYVKSYHYIDDARYARNYINFKKNSRSKRQLLMELMHKGLKKEDIELAFEEEYDNEDVAIKRAIEKKINNKSLDTMTREEKMKVSSYLYRKGFEMDLIHRYIRY